MTILLGCIADDFTGATDLAGMLVQGGMRTVQVIGVPRGPLPANITADAVVIALKSRTSPVQDAVADSLAALQWLRSAGCRQVYFKYCSTFDSTDQGNIGPVTEALMDALDTPFTIACPAFPENGRTVFKGYLFVGDTLLQESGMQHHPLTPMTDSNLVRVLQRQTAARVGLIDHLTVKAGAQAISRSIQHLKAEGIGIAVVDATSDDDLMQIGAACASLPLLTAGSGVALGLPQNFRAQGLLDQHLAAGSLPPTPGLRAIVCGSCSQATQAQLADLAAKGVPCYPIDPLQLVGSPTAFDDAVGAAMAWAAPLLQQGPVAVYATAPADRVKAVQAAIGTERAGALVEAALAAVAQELVALGVRQLIVAGGETSGAVVTALAVNSLRIGPQIDPGVPWTVALADQNIPISLALKSGNFGSVDFFHQGMGSVAMSESKFREQICSLGASLHQRGLTAGSSGNISVRTDDGWLLTPTNSCLGTLDPSRISKMDNQGRLLSGDPPSKEAFLHRAMYDAREQAGAIVHLHSTHSAAVSCMSGLDHHSCIPPLTPYFVMKIGQLPLVPYYRPGDPDLAGAIRGLAGKHSAVLLANHGPVVSGKTLEAAVYAIEELEETAKLFLLLQGHNPRVLTEEQIAELHAVFKL